MSSADRGGTRGQRYFAARPAANPLFEPAIAIVETAAEAIALHAVLEPCPAFIDIKLPDANGVDLLASLLRRRPALCAIVVSIHNEPIYPARVAANDARGFVADADIVPDLLLQLHKTFGAPALRPAIAGRAES
jgi:DNA-binding NarL/FixJ family response regulator